MTRARRTASIACTVNGTARRVRVPAATTLVELLRDRLGLTGTKVGCDGGECGACTVLLDDEPVLACLVLAAEVDGCAIRTIEAEGDARLAALQEAFVAEAALQCGFCTPGLVLAAYGLPPDAGDAAIRAALAGNLCRCTGYAAIVRAVRRAGRGGASPRGTRGRRRRD